MPQHITVPPPFLGGYISLEVLYAFNFILGNYYSPPPMGKMIKSPICYFLEFNPAFTYGS